MMFRRALALLRLRCPSLSTWAYAWLTLKHKWYVYQAGRRTKAPLWRLIIHDWSKFTPSELPAYGRQFFTLQKGPPGEFEAAWLHHQNLNPHHWEFWIPRSAHDRSSGQADEPLPMPEHFVREMVADWLGAARAYEGAFPRRFGEWDFLKKKLPQMRLHEETSALVFRVLREVFPYDVEEIEALEMEMLLR